MFIDDDKHVGQRLTDGVCVVPSGEALRHRIEAGHATLVVGRDDGISDAEQGDPEAFGQLRDPGR